MKRKARTAMKYNNGMIALWRKFLDWEWYEDVNTKAVFLHLLLTANWKDGKWKGKRIKRGQRWTSYNNVAKETGLSVQNVRTAIAHLESTGEITKESTHKGMLINVENYDSYQTPLCESNTPNNQRSNITGESTKEPTHAETPTNVENHDSQQLTLCDPNTLGNQRPNKETTKNQQQMNKDNKNNNTYIAENADSYEEIVSYLNQKTGKRFKAETEATRKLINARLREGYAISDFKQVIDTKVAQWKDDETMNKYLQPSTLFSTKFEGYVNENTAQEKSEPMGFKELR